MIRLFDLPGVAEVEARVVMNRIVGLKQRDHQLDSMVQAVNSCVFGAQPDPDRSWDFRGDGRWDLLDEDEDDGPDDFAYWKGNGWDVTGPEGKVLECLHRFEEVMTYVTAGVSGNPIEEIEAEAWAANQVGNVPPAASEQAQNRAFLSLGSPGRRR